MIVFSPDAIEDVARLRSLLNQINPGAVQRAVTEMLRAIESLREFPDRGMLTNDPDIRQIVVRFGSSGYVVRYAIVSQTRDILVTRIWHAREDRR